MQPPDPKELRWLDIAGLVIAGIINSLIAPATAGLVLAAGMIGQGGDLAARSTSVAANPAQWQWGWSVWFFVTLSFAWSYYALARHLGGARQWRDLSVGVAVIAAAVDLVGILVYIVILPPLAQGIQSADVGTGALTYASFESLAYALTNVGAFGFYTIAGLLLLPATFATTRYPRWLAWLGVILWGVSALATALLIFVPSIATPPLVISILLFGPWVWGSAWWIWRKRD